MKESADSIKSLSEVDWLISEGVSLIPLKSDGSKEPLDKWKEFQDRKSTPEEITRWKEQTNNFAVVCGAISGNLTIIDIDHAELFEKLNLGEVAAKTKTDKTPHGYHIWLRTETLRNDKNLKYEGTKEIEFKSNNALVTIAGSMNEEGIRYEHFLTSPRKIATVPDGFFSDLEKIYNDYRQTGKKGFAAMPKGITLKGGGIQKIITVFADKLNELVDHGDYLTCHCPFPDHEDKTPSFRIYPATNSYYCWGCNRGGNAINFVADFLGVSKKKARERLESDGWLAEKTEKTEEEELKRKAHFEIGGRLYLEILTRDEQYQFAYLNDNGDVELRDTIEDVAPVELLRTQEGELAHIVKMPDERIASCDVLTAGELLQKIETHIAAYCDMAERDMELCSYYALFTWFYKKANTTGYLRFLADIGKGKSRMQQVIGDVCFYPTSTGGSGSFSGMMRTHEHWHGTLLIDEGDTKGDKNSPQIKYLNLGLEAGKYYILSDKKNPRYQQVFDPFGPKIIGMREHFRDNATESRLLSISPYATTNEDIPILLDKAYEENTGNLRNEIARFVLTHWNDIDGEQMVSFKGMDIEPRLRQLAMPLSIIFQLWEKGVEKFKSYIVARQKELKKDRALSWEGSMFNLVYGIANGDEELKEEFGAFYNGDEIEAITPSMVAKLMNTTTRTTTDALRSIGFDVELKWITLWKRKEELQESEQQQIEEKAAKEQEEEKKREGKTRKVIRKRVRRYVVLDEKTWREIITRYHYNEDEEDNNTDINIPDVLRSRKYISGCVKYSVPTVPSVPQKKIGTDGTDGTGEGTHTKKKLSEVGGDGKGDEEVIKGVGEEDKTPNTELVSLCGRRFDTAEVLRDHTTNCKACQAIQDKDARKGLDEERKEQAKAGGEQ